jgi:hypothetical protein
LRLFAEHWAKLRSKRRYDLQHQLIGGQLMRLESPPDFLKGDLVGQSQTGGGNFAKDFDCCGAYRFPRWNWSEDRFH